MTGYPHVSFVARIQISSNRRSVGFGLVKGHPVISSLRTFRVSCHFPESQFPQSLFPKCLFPKMVISAQRLSKININIFLMKNKYKYIFDEKSIYFIVASMEIARKIYYICEFNKKYIFPKQTQFRGFSWKLNWIDI